MCNYSSGLRYTAGTVVMEYNKKGNTAETSLTAGTAVYRTQVRWGYFYHNDTANTPARTATVSDANNHLSLDILNQTNSC